MTRSKSAGLWLCAASLVATPGSTAESRADLRDLGPCTVGTVVNADQYCSHERGDNDFTFSVKDREACIQGGLTVRDFRHNNENVKIRIGKMQMNVPRTCAGSGELRVHDFVAGERSGIWTIQSLPASAGPPKERTLPSAAWQAPWADRAFPQIDYSRPVFRQAHKSDHRISGWWIIPPEKRGVDIASATNVSAFRSRAVFPVLLQVVCREGKLGILHSPGGLVSKFHTPLVTYRFGEGQVVDTAWHRTSNSKKIGMGGDAALDFVRKMRNHEDSELSIGVRRRPDDELRERTFSLLGIRTVLGAFAKRCPGLDE